MSPPSTCAQCSAAHRADAAWCPVCFATVAAVFDPLTAPIDEVLGGGVGTATVTGIPQPVVEAVAQPVLEPVVRPVDPVLDPLAEAPDQLVPEVPDPVDEITEISDTDVMLAMLAAEHRQSDSTAQIVEQMGDKGARVLLMIGGTIVIALVLFAGIAGLGAIT